MMVKPGIHPSIHSSPRISRLPLDPARLAAFETSPALLNTYIELRLRLNTISIRFLYSHSIDQSINILSGINKYHCEETREA